MCKNTNTITEFLVRSVTPSCLSVGLMPTNLISLYFSIDILAMERKAAKVTPMENLTYLRFLFSTNRNSFNFPTSIYVYIDILGKEKKR